MSGRVSPSKNDPNLQKHKRFVFSRRTEPVFIKHALTNIRPLLLLLIYRTKSYQRIHCGYIMYIRFIFQIYGRRMRRSMLKTKNWPVSCAMRAQNNNFSVMFTCCFRDDRNKKQDTKNKWLD